MFVIKFPDLVSEITVLHFCCSLAYHFIAKAGPAYHHIHGVLKKLWKIFSNHYKDVYVGDIEQPFISFPISHYILYYNHHIHKNF